MNTKKSYYALGNCLRGYVAGDFKDVETAWKYLSQRFLMSFPSSGGREVIMALKREGLNEFGLEQTFYVICKRGITWRGNNLNKSTVMRMCTNTHSGMFI